MSELILKQTLPVDRSFINIDSEKGLIVLDEVFNCNEFYSPSLTGKPY